MEKCNTCPCPNLDCPNHGNCINCTSRHLKIKTLNYCGFYSILPLLKDVIEVSPDSESAKKVSALIEKQSKAYTKLMKIHSISEESQELFRIIKSELSKH